MKAALKLCLMAVTDFVKMVAAITMTNLYFSLGIIRMARLMRGPTLGLSSVVYSDQKRSQPGCGRTRCELQVQYIISDTRNWTVDFGGRPIAAASSLIQRRLMYAFDVHCMAQEMGLQPAARLQGILSHRREPQLHEPYAVRGHRRRHDTFAAILAVVLSQLPISKRRCLGALHFSRIRRRTVG